MNKNKHLIKYIILNLALGLQINTLGMGKRSIVFISLFFCFALGFAPESQAAGGYCEGHAKKIINVRVADLYNTIQRELDRFASPENEFNGRYEICFDIQTERGFVVLNGDQKFRINNQRDREVVIGFLKGQRNGDSNLPILELRGHNVTVFAPELSNAKQAIKMIGDGHKVVSGSIKGIVSGLDSQCILGQGNQQEVNKTQIEDCPNAITLSGDQNKIVDDEITFLRSDEMPRGENYNNLRGEEDIAKFIQDFGRWRNQNDIGTNRAIVINGNNTIIDKLILKGFQGVGLSLLGNGYRLTQSTILGESIPDDFVNFATPSGLLRRSSECVVINKSSDVTLEKNEVRYCHKGIYIFGANNIYIGPERFQDFFAKKNRLHHNDYAIHSLGSQGVFVRHNQMYENGRKDIPLSKEELRRVGWWPESTNYLEGVLLASPIFESILQTDDEDIQEVPVVKYPEGTKIIPVMGSVQANIGLEVTSMRGVIELSFLLIPEVGDKSHGWRYQPYQAFADCPFARDGKIQCPVSINKNMINRKVLAVIHNPQSGTSSYPQVIGIINDPSGIAVNIPSPEAGSMDASGQASNAGSNAGSSPSAEAVKIAQGGGESPAAGGGGSGGDAKSSSCQLNPESQNKNMKKFEWALFLIPLTIFWVLRNHSMRKIVPKVNKVSVF